MKVRLLLSVLILVSLASSACGYGVDMFAALRHERESTCVPINSAIYRMRQPDGVERIFIRAPDDPNRLQGQPPWMGVIRPERNMINIVTDDAFRGEKMEYCFVGGHLRYMSKGVRDYEFDPACYAEPTNSLAALWPMEEKAEKDAAAADMWQGSGRLRLFTKNPNRAGLICVEIALIAMGLSLFAGSKIWRLHGILWTLTASVLLLESQSRGGFVAFAAGVGILLIFRVWRGVGRRAFLLLLLAFLSMLVAFAAVARNRSSSVSERTGKEVSTAARIAIWKEVPRMISAAPMGWGFFQSGPAYNSWFERRENMHMIGDLFNDHLSRFVEGGFAFGGLYVFVWGVLLVGGFWIARKGGSPVPLAIWAAYFAAANFNPMIYWWQSLVLPLTASIWCLVRERKARCRLSGREWRGVMIGAGVVTFVTLGGLAAVAAAADDQDIPLRVTALGHRVIAGTGEPQVWVVEDGFVLDGDYYGFPGKEIRDYYRAHPKAEPLGLVKSVSDLPRKIRTLVLVGKSGEAYLNLPPAKRTEANSICFLSPPFEYDIITKDGDLMRKSEINFMRGEFACRRERHKGEDVPAWVHVVPGAELYLPGWLESVVGERD